MLFGSFNTPWIQALKNNEQFLNNPKNEKCFIKHPSLPTLPIPLFCDRKHYNELCNAASVLLGIQKKVIQFLIKNYSHEYVLSIFKLPSSINNFIDWTDIQKGNKTIARLDIVPTSCGYKFCEFNIDTTVIGGECYDLYRYYLESNLPFDCQGDSPQKVMASYFNQEIKKKKISRVVLLTLKKYVHQVEGVLSFFKKHIEDISPGIPVFIQDEDTYLADCSDMEEETKTLVFRMFFYEDIKDQPLLTQLFESNTTIINSFETEILSSKFWFDIFHSSVYQKLLTHSEINSIKRFIPFTKRLSEQNYDFFLRKKDKYVFKIHNSYGGKNILLGKECSKQSLNKHISDPSEWVVQDFMECESFELPDIENSQLKPHKIVLGLFNTFGIYSGLFVRGSTTKRVVSGSVDARLGWAFPILRQERDFIISKIDISSN